MQMWELRMEKITKNKRGFNNHMLFRFLHTEGIEKIVCIQYKLK